MTSQPAGGSSPRAGVERLWPGERPFTDFGQFGYGHLDRRVFDDDNDTYWCDITGRAHRITDMTADYRHNVLAFLEHKARYFHLMMIRRRLLELSSVLADGRVDPLDLHRLYALLGLDPVTWVTTTPIALALKHAAQSAPQLPHL